MMFSAFCPTHNSRILMTRRNAIGFWNTADGPVIRWRCNCGHQGVLTGDGAVAGRINTKVPGTEPAAA
jgi:hypothetical protein